MIDAKNGLSVQTDYIIQAQRPGLIIIDNYSKLLILLFNTIQINGEYLDLAWELKRAME